MYVSHKVAKSQFSQRGSMAVWLVGIMPVLVIAFCFFVDIILFVDARIRMQTAVDRGLYAGASYLAHVMNEVAMRNWTFRKEYLIKEEAFKKSKDNKKLIEKLIKELNYNQGDLYDQMKALLDEGYATAHGIAQDVIEKNLENMPHLPVSIYVPEYGDPSQPMFDMVNEWSEDAGKYINKEILIPYEIVGTSYDPNKYEAHPNVAFKYLIKDSEYFVALAGRVVGSFRPPLLAEYFAGDDGEFEIQAIAAAQPYGGSIRDFAHVDAESAEAAEAEIASSGRDLLYHPAIIPIKRVLEDVDVEY